MRRRLTVFITALATVVGTSVLTLTATPAAHAAAGDGARKVIDSNFADPGFGKFTTAAQGTNYYLYATGGNADTDEYFRAARSGSVMSGYSIVGHTMHTKPAWVRGVDPGMWAPHVFQTGTTPGRERFTMFFNGRRSGDGKHCIGAAYSGYTKPDGTVVAGSPTGPFIPLDEPLVCPPSDFDQAIDASEYVNEAGNRYVVYKLGIYEPTRKFRIMALRVNNDRGMYRLSGATPRVVLTESQTGGFSTEAPDMINTPDGRVHLFVSRYSYLECSYSTQVWSGDGMFSLGNARWVNGMGPETGDRFCGPGGAEIIRDGSDMFMAFHTRYSADPFVRHTWVDGITRSSTGVWALR